MSRSLRAAPVPILALGLVFSLGCFGDVELEACTLSETYCDAAETTVPANSVGATAGLTDTTSGTSGAAESGGEATAGETGAATGTTATTGTTETTATTGDRKSVV